MKTKKIESLFNLLDDEDEQIARSAMAELINSGENIDKYLKEYQESEDIKLRRRIHQIESILLLRERRSSFKSFLEQADIDLIDGLFEVHLQWFDNDSKVQLIEEYEEFEEETEKYQLRDLEQLAYFMRKTGFQLPENPELNAPENYCLGVVLEERIGADIILCVIAFTAAMRGNRTLRIIHQDGTFALTDDSNNILSPQNNWQISHRNGNGEGDFDYYDDPRKIIKFVTLMLFQYAVSSDSFRYIYTIGYSLYGHTGDDILDFLPYPYSRSEQ